MSKLKKFDAAEYLDTPERLSPPHNSTTRAMAALGQKRTSCRAGRYVDGWSLCDDR